MRRETAGKPLKYAGNGDFRRGTEARIINNLEMRMRRRRSALFSRPRGRTTAAARRGAHIRRIQKSPGNARITAFLRLLDDMSRSAPSRKSQQQTKRTRASRLMLLNTPSRSSSAMDRAAQRPGRGRSPAQTPHRPFPAATAISEIRTSASPMPTPLTMRTATH